MTLLPDPGDIAFVRLADRWHSVVAGSFEWTPTGFAFRDPLGEVAGPISAIKDVRIGSPMPQVHASLIEGRIHGHRHD